MDAQLRARLNQTVMWRAYKGQTGAGVPQYAEPVAIKGYLTGKTLFRSSKSGEMIVSQQVLYVDEVRAPLITNKDLMTLPNGLVCPVRDTQPYYDEKGQLSYGEVYL